MLVQRVLLMAFCLPSSTALTTRFVKTLSRLLLTFVVFSHYDMRYPKASSSGSKVVASSSGSKVVVRPLLVVAKW